MLVSLVSSLVTFAPMMPVQAAPGIALQSLTATLAQPIYSADWAAPAKTNVSYDFRLSKDITALTGDPCIATSPCMGVFVDVEDYADELASTTTHQKQEWSETISASDITLTNAPGGVTVASIQREDSGGNGVFEWLKVNFNCSTECTFTSTTIYHLQMVNGAIKNPVAPAGYAPGMYTSLKQNMQVRDFTVAPEYIAYLTAVVAVGKGLTVTASVDPTLTFSVTGNPVESAIKNEISNVAPTDADTCNFGTLTPTVAKICAFSLHIATNASNGYSIYVVQDQNMTFNGNAVKQFNSGSIATYPGSVWAAPSDAQLAHLGYWSSDSSVFSGVDLFPNWAGIPTIAGAGAPPVTTALVADSALPESNDYTYAIKIQSAATLPQGTGYTHHEYFMVVGNF
jgi:hypothetical protein